jgi:hypothetical protein
MLESRKWKAVLLLAFLYGLLIAFKFFLVLKQIPLAYIQSFDETSKWAMLGMGASVSTYVYAIAKEDAASKSVATNVVTNNNLTENK